MSGIFNRNSASAIGAVDSLTGNSGGAVSPNIAGNITVVGTGVIDVVGTPGTNTLTISSSSVASSYVTDSGTATPAGGILDVVGSHGINTSGAGDTVTIAVNNTLTLGDLSPVGAGSSSLTLTTGDLTVTSGNVNLPTTADADNGVIEVNSARFIHSYGTNNSFLGSGAGNFVLTGLNATGIGKNALAALTDGGSNTSVGVNSSLLLNGGDRNCALGVASLQTITTGSDNIALGYSAGSSYATTDSNNIAIGSIGVAADSGRIRIGTNGTHTSTFFAGIEGVNVGSVAEVVTIDADELGSAVITAGAGITITPGANTITITNTGGGGVFAWTEITAASAGMAVNNGYIANRATLVTLTLPAVAAVGEVVRVAGKGVGLWLIAQNAGQTIHFGASNTTTGAGGSLAAILQYDCVELLCTTANTDFVVLSVLGNLTVV
jgi:hypothetical protein